jgi:hypothetical protein
LLFGPNPHFIWCARKVTEQVTRRALFTLTLTRPSPIRTHRQYTLSTTLPLLTEPQQLDLSIVVHVLPCNAPLVQLSVATRRSLKFSSLSASLLFIFALSFTSLTTLSASSAAVSIIAMLIYSLDLRIIPTLLRY